ncbi:MAG TPA: RNA pyrophosphohydrolase [Aestuariivirga sp.]|nr:RNA pyrophosphohydrolase [Aestuariivirga sp.]
MAKAITAYRPCVGAMLVNAQGLVWIGHRFDKSNEEGPGDWWQMPQGGIDKGEDPREAALRELAEETSITSAEVIAESPRWYKYDLPEHLIGKAWKGRYRGQTQKWFALRFTGEESEINLAAPGHSQEFDGWRWARMEEVAGLIVPFKRMVYEQVIADFRHLGA